jgi:short-subunit dehydrogenase
MSTLTVVITGSTRGIGRGLAREFLLRKHQVIINGRNKNVVDRIVKELESQGHDVLGVAGDVRKESTFDSIVDEAMASYGKIDIWINNAGIPQAHKLFHELDSTEIEDVISVNVTSLMLGTNTALRLFKQQGHGLVLNMEGFGSDGRTIEKLTLYGTTKRAVHYFSKSLSKEVKEENIRIGILSPGMVKTDFLTDSATRGDTSEQIRTQKIFDILAEDKELVTSKLVKKILRSTKKYDRIVFLTPVRMIPKILRLMFVR